MVSRVLLALLLQAAGSAEPIHVQQAQALEQTLRQTGRESRLLRAQDHFQPVPPFPNMPVAIAMIAGLRGGTRADGSVITQVAIRIREVPSRPAVAVESMKSTIGAPDAVRDEVRDPDAKPAERARDKVYWWGILGLGVADGSGEYAEWLYVTLPDPTRKK